MVFSGVSNNEGEKMVGQPSLYALSFTRDNSLQVRIDPRVLPKLVVDFGKVLVYSIIILESVK